MRISSARARILLTLLLFVGGCAPKYYAPNTHNVPLLTRRGDFSGAFAFGDSRGELQGAYGVTENIGLMLNGAVFDHKNDQEGDGGEGGLLEVGVGYRVPLSAGFQLGVYGLLGGGNVENHFPSTVAGNPGTTGVLEADLSRFGIQPVVGFRSRYVEAAGSVRLLGLRYSQINGSLVVSGEDQVQLLRSQSEHTLLEPAITVRAGFETVKLQLQLGWSFNKGHSNFPQDEAHLTAGVVYSPR